ncbi:MAG: hypothetical protein AAF493_00425 [Pseudomonadota bacterium]
MRRSTLATIVGIAVLIGLAAVWFLRNFELRDVEVYKPFEGEAAVNEWLAARRLLRAMGLDARDRSAWHPNRKLGPHDVVVFGKAAASDLPVFEVIEWIEAGGVAIIDVGALVLPPIALELDVHRRRVDEETKSRRIARDLFVQTDARFVPGIEEGGGNDCAMKQSLGAGEIVWLCDLSWANNWSIGNVPHAQALFRLAVSATNRTEVEQPVRLWLFRRIDQPSLFSILWNDGRLAVITFLVLLLLFGWRASRRFGPLRPSPSTARRSLGEHLQSVGWFLWRTDRRELLLAGLRDEVIAKSPAVGKDISLDERIRQLAHATGESAERIRHALYDAPTSQRGEFVERVATLIRMRRSL